MTYFSLKSILLTSILVVTPVHVANAMFQQCYVESGFKAITAKALRKKVNAQAQHMGICYEAAFCLAEAEGNLQSQQVSYLRGIMKEDVPGAGSYSQAYRDIMEIPSSDGLKTALTTGYAVEEGTLGLNNILESGFINFRHTIGEKQVFHTVYLQVTKSGKKYLYTANDMKFLLYLDNGRHVLPKSAGRAQYLVIDGGQGAELTLEGFNKWLNSPEHNGYTGFHFTPVSKVSQNLARAMIR